jgi:hypothetical protein
MEQVRDLSHLHQLAQEKKAVVITKGRGWMGRQGYTPAAWAMNFSGSALHYMIPNMYVYEPKPKEGKQDAGSTETREEKAG